MTNEILPSLFDSKAREESHDGLAELEKLLVEIFALPAVRKQRTWDDFPPLPLLLSLVDTAIDRKEPLSRKWPAARLTQVRHAIEYAIFLVLDRSLRAMTVNPHQVLFERIYQSFGEFPTVLSLNYDIIADNTLLQLSDLTGQRGFADFGCDIATESYRKNLTATLLLKLHGSLNWLYCAACHRMDVALSQSERDTIKVFPGDVWLEKRFGLTLCRTCKSQTGSVMITPTYRKDYRNPHVARIWYEAERALRNARRVIFIGYSLPEDDVEVIYLLKRGLHGLPAENITVVEMKSKSGQHLNVARRYRQIFGDGIDWHATGFAGWLKTAGPKLGPAG